MGRRRIRRGIAGCMAAIMLLTMAARAESPEEQERQPRGYLALTFDDGPSGALTERLLDGLQARGARATFFLCGYRMEQYPAALDRYLAEGHEIGVHSTVHTDLTKLSPQEVQQDMAETAGKIHSLTGISPRVMRPPGGAYNEAVCREAAREGMSVILWSVDTEDWTGKSAGEIADYVISEAKDGDIILLHDIFEESVQGAVMALDDLMRRGYTFVTVNDLLADRGIAIQSGKVYRQAAQGGK